MSGEKTLNYIHKTRDKLESMEKEPPPSQTADVIMANLHQIPSGADKVDLFDFYTNSTREIILKRGLSPQKFAEQLYKKSKNKKIEFDQLRKTWPRRKWIWMKLLRKKRRLTIRRILDP